MLPQVAIYQPTEDEVLPLMDAARQRFPQLVSRIDKAQEILLSGGISLEPVAWQLRNAPHWQIASQRPGHGDYIIPGGQCCHCQDRRAPVLGTRRLCKHAIAMGAYLRILRNRLNADIRCFNVELSVLGNGELHAFAEGLGYVQMHRDGDVYKFSTQASPAHYAIWLARQAAMQWLVHSIANDVREMIEA